MSLKNKKDLSLFDLTCIAAGQVIGAGVITVIGSSIAVTGRSAYLAYAVAVFIGFFRVLPVLWYSSARKVSGGYFGMISESLGDRVGGLSVAASLCLWLSRGTAVVAMGNYFNSVFPNVNAYLASTIIWTLLVIINLFGVNIMAKIQSLATPLLIIALLAFAIVGIVKAPAENTSFNNPEFITNGFSGFSSAVVLMIYSCFGQKLVISYTSNAQNPKKNIPLSMILSTLVILVVYPSVAYAASNVLPLDSIAGKPLTVTARAIFPSLIFVLFMIGGPILALLTTCNSGIAANSVPVARAAREGWLPDIFAKTNKYGVCWFNYLLIWLVGMFPILMKMSISQITNYVLLISSLQNVLIMVAVVRLPTKFKEDWKDSWLHVPDAVFYILMALSLAFEAFIVYKSVVNLSFALVMINLCTLAVAVVYGVYRMKAGRIRKIEEE